ncbi:MAG TPA: prepilin-type N-terminal cleavage/methylation domain-containing protein [Myxococcaceae bacterium]|nr:prepilin-type N-terminal cleavage/methylation domain-containing protein [Myxococcaceae bacterium]
MTRARSPAGFTLIELIVALAVATTLFGTAAVGIGALTGARARAALGELGATIRALYDVTALTGHTCRLAFDLPPDEASGFTYRAECASGQVTVAADRDQALQDDARARAEAARRGARPPAAARASPSLLDVLAQEKDRVEAAERFAAFTAPEVQPRRIAGVRLSVWTAHQRQPARTGLAYLYFFPQGSTERAQLTARQGGSTWTLTVAPLTGKTAVVSGEPEIPRS